MSEILMKIEGSKILSNSWKQELQVLEDGVYGETLVVGRREKMRLAFENIAQINIIRSVFTSDIEIINKGGAGNLIIKAVNKKEADEAKELIEKKMNEAKSKQSTGYINSVADEIRKLAELKDQRIITEEEFDKKKKQLLGL